MVMGETRNLATSANMEILREEISNHAISLAGVIISSHTRRMGINHTTVAEVEKNLVTGINHRRVVVVIRDLAVIIVDQLKTIMKGILLYNFIAYNCVPHV